MQFDPLSRRTRQHLIEAVKALAGGQAELAHHIERAWASVTFAGTRHTMSLVFAGAEAVAAGELFIAALPDHEFTLPRQLVADAVVTFAEHTMLPEPRLAIEIELLILEDA